MPHSELLNSASLRNECGEDRKAEHENLPQAPGINAGGTAESWGRDQPRSDQDLGLRARSAALRDGGAGITSTYGLQLRPANFPKTDRRLKWKPGCVGSASHSPRMPYEPHSCLSRGDSTARRWAPAQASRHSPALLSAPPCVERSPGPSDAQQKAVTAARTA